MQFNATTTRTGLVQDCEDLLGFPDTGISGNANLLKRFTRMMNEWYRQANAWIWEATGTWEYDDRNYTNLPIATTDLVDGQQDYELPSTAQKIDRLEVLNKSGNYCLVLPMDKSKSGVAMSEFYKVDGLPVYYDLVGNSIMLYPAPATAHIVATDGLQVYFSRGISGFVSTNTTRTPGFNEDFHRILSLGASLDYAIGNEMPQANNLKVLLTEMKDGLQRFHGFRHRDLKPRFIPSSLNESHI